MLESTRVFRNWGFGDLAFRGSWVGIVGLRVGSTAWFGYLKLGAHGAHCIPEVRVKIRKFPLRSL